MQLVRKNLSRRWLPILVFTLPAATLFTIMATIPIIRTAYWSLFEWDGFTTPVFVAFGNYLRLFRDRVFYLSLKNGFYYAAVITVYQIGMGTVMAILLSNQRIRGRKIFKTAYFVPVVLSVTVTSLLWVQVYNSQHGLLNNLLSAFGFQFRQRWLSSADSAIFAVAAVNAWQFMGLHMILIFAGIKSIPTDYFEAARIDGASSWSMTMRITLPLLRETYKYCLILSITSGIRAFEPIYIMTGGGPGTSTYTLTYHMFRAAFRLNQYGYASSSAVMLVVLCMLVLVIVGRFVARERIAFG